MLTCEEDPAIPSSWTLLRHCLFPAESPAPLFHLRKVARLWSEAGSITGEVGMWYTLKEEDRWLKALRCRRFNR